MCMKQEIDLDTLKDVLKISYPTALKMAREHGRLKDEPPKGRWLVPVATIEELIAAERQATDLKASRLQAAIACGNEATS